MFKDSAKSHPSQLLRLLEAVSRIARMDVAAIQLYASTHASIKLELSCPKVAVSLLGSSLHCDCTDPLVLAMESISATFHIKEEAGHPKSLNLQVPLTSYPRSLLPMNYKSASSGVFDRSLNGHYLVSKFRHFIKLNTPYPPFLPSSLPPSPWHIVVRNEVQNSTKGFGRFMTATATQETRSVGVDVGKEPALSTVLTLAEFFPDIILFQ